MGQVHGTENEEWEMDSFNNSFNVHKESAEIVRNGMKDLGNDVHDTIAVKKQAAQCPRRQKRELTEQRVRPSWLVMALLLLLVAQLSSCACDRFRGPLGDELPALEGVCAGGGAFFGAEAATPQQRAAAATQVEAKGSTKLKAPPKVSNVNPWGFALGLLVQVHIGSGIEVARIAHVLGFSTHAICRWALQTTIFGLPSLLELLKIAHRLQAARGPKKPSQLDDLLEVLVDDNIARAMTPCRRPSRPQHSSSRARRTRPSESTVVDRSYYIHVRT